MWAVVWKWRSVEQREGGALGAFQGRALCEPGSALDVARRQRPQRPPDFGQCQVREMPLVQRRDPVE